MNILFEKEHIKEEINVILSEIYRKHFSKNIDNPCDKYVLNFTTFKKNLDKENDYITNLYLIKTLIEKISKIFKEFKRKVFENSEYKIIKTKLKEIIVRNVTDCKRKTFWNEHKNKIYGIFNDINIIYKTINKASTDIDHLFHHPLTIIAAEKNVRNK